MLLDALILLLHKSGYKQYQPYEPLFIYDIVFEYRNKLHVNVDDILSGIFELDEYLMFDERNYAMLIDGAVKKAIKGIDVNYVIIVDMSVILKEKLKTFYNCEVGS